MRIALLLSTAALFAVNVQCHRGSMEMKEKLAKSFSESEPELSDLLQDSSTTIETLETPFLKHHQVLQISFQNEPMDFVTVNEKGYSRKVSGEKFSWLAVMHDDPVELKTEAEAIQYMKVTFEVMKERPESWYVIENIEDTRFKKSLERIDAEGRNDFVSEFKDIIQPMQAKANEDGFEINYYLIENHLLNKCQCQLASSGDFECKSELFMDHMIIGK